tara:strand:+ start:6266 stop:6484 length:219 start_codon:yes stop_codon:yes gene_type:complete
MKCPKREFNLETYRTSTVYQSLDFFLPVVTTEQTGVLFVSRQKNCDKFFANTNSNSSINYCGIFIKLNKQIE